MYTHTSETFITLDTLYQHSISAPSKCTKIIVMGFQNNKLCPLDHIFHTTMNGHAWSHKKLSRNSFKSFYSFLYSSQLMIITALQVRAFCRYQTLLLHVKLELHVIFSWKNEKKYILFVFNVMLETVSNWSYDCVVYFLKIFCCCCCPMWFCLYVTQSNNILGPYFITDTKQSS